MDRGRGDAGRVLQLAGGAGGQRGTVDGDARAGPGLPGGIQRERLAGAGPADHDHHPVAVEGEAADHVSLLAAQAFPLGKDSRGQLCGHGGDAGARPGDGRGERLALRQQQASGGQAYLVLVADHDASVTPSD